jgi:hypothetical protein
LNSPRGSMVDTRTLTNMGSSSGTESMITGVTREDRQ